MARPGPCDNRIWSHALSVLLIGDVSAVVALAAL